MELAEYGDLQGYLKNYGPLREQLLNPQVHS
jgi:hypothetical protein